MAKCMNLIITCLYYAGFWPATHTAPLPRAALYIFARLQLARMAYGACVQSYNLYLDWGSVGRMIEYVTFLIIDVRLFIHIYILIYRHGELASIVNYFREKQELHCQAHDPEQRRIISRCNLATHVMTIVLNATMCAALVGVAVILGAYGMVHREIPFRKWFPIDVFYSPVFEIVLWTLMVTQIWDMLLMTTFDVLFIAIHIQLMGQFALLNWKLANMDGLVYAEIHRRLEAELLARKLDVVEETEPTTKSKARNKTRKVIRNQKGVCNPPTDRFPAKSNEKNVAEARFIRLCVDHHNELVEICGVVATLFHSSHVAQMTQNALTCLALVYITNLTQNIDAKVAVEGALILACCAEFFIFCVLGTALLYDSTEMVFSAYSANWTGLTKSAKMSLQIIMTRALKGVEFRAFHVFPVTVGTYVAVLKFSYSVYAVLDTMSSVPKVDET